jgi:hypothetical protein
VYLGSNSGNSAAIVAACNASSNTAIGILAAGALSNSTNSEFLGYQTGGGAQNIQYSVLLGVSTGYRSSNILNSIFIGSSNSIQLSNVSNTISIGQSAGGTGNSNIYMGMSTGSNMTGSRNVFIGNALNTATFPAYSGLSATSSNKLAIGSSNSVLIGGDFSNGVVAIGTNTNALASDGSPINTLNYNQEGYGFLGLDVANWTRIGKGLTIGTDPPSLNVSKKYELDVNGHFRVDDGFASLSFTNYYNSIQSNTVLTLSPTDTNTTGTTTLDLRGNLLVSNYVQSAGYYTVKGSAVVNATSTSLVPITLKPGRLAGTILETGSSWFYSANSVLITSNTVTPPTVIQMSNTLNITYIVNASSPTIGNITLSNADSSARTIYYTFTLYPVT